MVCYNNRMKVKAMRKVIGGMILTVAVLLSGCGSSSTSGSGGSGQNGSGGSKDLSSIAKKPDFSWHASYLTGKHASFGCGDTCHTPSLTAKAAAGSAGYQVTSDRKQICYQCHAANYNATSALNHSASNTGTYCNSCHYSDSFKTHNRLSHDQYHMNITSSCATCHAGRAPASHASSGRTSGCESCHSYKNGAWSLTSGAHNHTSGCSSCHSGKKPASHANRPDTCESCHSYPSWAGAKMNHNGLSDCSSCHAGRAPANHFGAACGNCHSYPSWKGAKFNHSGVSGGCASCHTKHYSGYACEGCHTSGFNWGFSHNRVSSSNCSACHDNGGGDDGGDDGGGHDD